MHVIKVDDLDESGVALKLALILKDMDTRLVSILIDVSGSTGTRTIERIIKSTLDGISNAFSISVSEMSKVNLIQFDSMIENITTLYQKDLSATLLTYQLFCGGAGNLQPVIELLKGDGFNMRRKEFLRVGSLAKTPVIMISDGFFDDCPCFHDMQTPSPFGDNETIFLKY
jgi:hypothetical protein